MSTVSSVASASDNSLVIQTRGLTKTYKDVNALQNLDLQVPRNSICGFLGPNGAGKSTTIKLLLGLIRPTNGSADVFGLDSVRESVAIRPRVGGADPFCVHGVFSRDGFHLHFMFRVDGHSDRRRAKTYTLLSGYWEYSYPNGPERVQQNKR